LTESLVQPAWLDAQGRREGRYVIGPLLGTGAMGEVHEAWDIVLARPVALKILQHLEPAAMIRFMHEAQLHARLDSPNICRIYDVDATGGTPRIAMQLVRGPTLEDAAKDLRLDEIVAILAQVAEAVHGAHQLNLIHRDLKPSNILLQWSEHGGWTPFLCDFGLAMALDGPSVTQPLALTGTPAYMAPEQVRGDRRLVGPPTDVYGIGSTLYFALTGRPPCVSTTTAEMLRVKRERRFPSPRSLELELPQALEAILLKCLEPDPGRRYPTAADLAGALRAFQATLPGPPPPARGWRDRFRPGPGGRRLALAGLGLLVCLAGTLPILASRIKGRLDSQDLAGQTITLEAASLEQSIRNERLLPLHDLRPANARTRARMEALAARMDTLGPGAEGPVRFALGRASFLLGDLPQAQVHLARAWAAGWRTPDTAFLLAQIHAARARGAADAAAFLGQPPPAAEGEAMAQARQFLSLARLQTGQPREYAEALGAWLQGDWPGAAEHAREGLEANPWHLESAILGSRCLALLARQRLEAGDPEDARGRYQEALDLAQGALVRGQSEQRLHHACCTAGLGLAALALDQGELTAGGLADLELETGRQIELDPDNQDAQSDWLQVRALKAQYLRGLGQDPRAVLDQALQFYWTRTAEPRSLELRMDHMVLYGLQAERDAARGEDPLPGLNEAMKDPGHTFSRTRDFQADLLNFKARFEASRGQDPRPTIEAIVSRYTPPPGLMGTWRPCETAARAWLTRAEWELSQKLDATASIHQAQILLQRAQELNPASASNHAMQGLARMLEAQCQPANRKWLLARAAEHGRWAMKLNRWDPELARLRNLLAKSG